MFSMGKDHMQTLAYGTKSEVKLDHTYSFIFTLNQELRDLQVQMSFAWTICEILHKYPRLKEETHLSYTLSR